MLSPEISVLRDLFAFGLPGGGSKVQRAIGRYLDGNSDALEKMPTIKAHFNRTWRRIEALHPDPDAPEYRKVQEAIAAAKPSPGPSF